MLVYERCGFYRSFFTIKKGADLCLTRFLTQRIIRPLFIIKRVQKKQKSRPFEIKDLGAVVRELLEEDRKQRKIHKRAGESFSSKGKEIKSNRSMFRRAYSTVSEEIRSALTREDVRHILGQGCNEFCDYADNKNEGWGESGQASLAWLGYSTDLYEAMENDYISASIREKADSILDELELSLECKIKDSMISSVDKNLESEIPQNLLKSTNEAVYLLSRDEKPRRRVFDRHRKKLEEFVNKVNSLRKIQVMLLAHDIVTASLSKKQKDDTK